MASKEFLYFLGLLKRSKLHHRKTEREKKNGIIIEHSIIIMNPTYQNAGISSLLRKWNKAYREGAGDKPVRQLH
jgi:hypothetical protein